MDAKKKKTKKTVMGSYDWESPRPKKIRRKALCILRYDSIVLRAMAWDRLKNGHRGSKLQIEEVNKSDVGSLVYKITVTEVEQFKLETEIGNNQS